MAKADVQHRSAVALLIDDHNIVKELFAQFEATDSEAQKRKIAQKACMELKIHAAIEEEIFYPAIRKAVGPDMMDEADEEHHVAKLLIAELEAMDFSGDHWEAKFTVLSENIEHHVKEEEGDIFPVVRKSDVDLSGLCDEMMARKDDLKTNGIPASAENMLIAKGGIMDSPRDNARRH